MSGTGRLAGLVFCVFVMVIPAAVGAENGAPDTGELELIVTDLDTDAAIGNATVRFLDIELEGTTDENGRAEFEALPPDELAVQFEHPDYYGDVVLVEIAVGERTVVRQELISQAATTEPAVVTTTGHRIGSQHIYRPSTTVEGDELQRNLTSSVPATLDAVPGFNAQYNGPGASSPTIRGMPGDRVLMLEDGHITGDIYWTAADHGVMVEPISAERIDVIRGPASLLYGSSSLGGVVNVIREDVPRFRPETVEGTAQTQYESVNHGFGGGVVLRGPLGPLAFYAEATGRQAGDTETPLGTIERTGMRSLNGAAGLSWVPEWGVIGGAFRYYDNAYDIPGEFGGELIPGGHPGGVTSEAQRMSARFLGEYHEPFGFFDGVELCANAVMFSHDEIERILEGEPVIGASFEQLTTDTHMLLYHQPLGSEEPGEFSAEGALGVSFQTRDLDVGGAAPGTRPGAERSAGVFGFEEFSLDPFRVQAGLRYDFRHVSTDDLSNIRVRTQDRIIEKEVSPRSFNAVSASLAGLWEVTDGWTLGVSFARSFRNPTIEELYSDGPHLADFSFDIGNPDLDSEIGHGVDLFLRTDLSRLNLEVAGYANQVENYIYYSPTGETVRVYRGDTGRTTPVFEARGDDALFVGAEGRVEWEVFDDIFLDTTVSYTWATRLADGDPLPFIPPLSGRLEARYDGESLFGSVGGTFGAPQNRVPRPIQIGDRSESPQSPTEGYALAHAMVGWRFGGQRLDHTLMLQAKNVANRAWRDHMSRIKEVAPQPGRNIQLSYRLLF